MMMMMMMMTMMIVVIMILIASHLCGYIHDSGSLGNYLVGNP